MMLISHLLPGCIAPRVPPSPRWHGQMLAVTVHADPTGFAAKSDPNLHFLVFRLGSVGEGKLQ